MKCAVITNSEDTSKAPAQEIFLLIDNMINPAIYDLANLDYEKALCQCNLLSQYLEGKCNWDVFTL